MALKRTGTQLNYVYKENCLYKVPLFLSTVGIAPTNAQISEHVLKCPKILERKVRCCRL